MTSTNSRVGFGRVYAVFVSVAFFSAGVIGVIGYLATQIWRDGQGVSSLLAGCGISLISSCVGAVPVAWVLSCGSGQIAHAVLGATAARFGTALLLVAPLVLGGWANKEWLVLWVAISYVLMLPADTLLAVRAADRLKGKMPR